MMRDIVDGLREHGNRATVLFLGVAAVGLGILIVGGLEAQSSVAAIQLAWLVSAGFTGLCLVGAALGFLTVHLERRHNAAERANLSDLIRHAAQRNNIERVG